MSQESCPISFIKIDATIFRINALYVLLVFILYFVTHNRLIILFLLADFLIRLFVNKNYSLLFLLSLRTKMLLHVKSKLEDSAPKTLASYFGLIFLVSIVIFDILDLQALFLFLSGIFVFCLFLELVFDYCVGCKIYYLYRKFFKKEV